MGYELVSQGLWNPMLSLLNYSCVRYLGDESRNTQHKDIDRIIIQISGSESFTRWLAPWGRGERARSKQGLLCLRVPTTSVGARSDQHPGTSLGPQEVPSSLPSLPEHPWVPGTFLGPQEAPCSLPLLLAHSPHPLSIPGSLEPPWDLRKPPARSPCPLSIPGSLEPSWGLRKSPACSPHSQLAPLAPTCSQLTPLTPNGLIGVRG